MSSVCDRFAVDVCSPNTSICKNCQNMKAQHTVSSTIKDPKKNFGLKPTVQQTIIPNPIPQKVEQTILQQSNNKINETSQQQKTNYIQQHPVVGSVKLNQQIKIQENQKNVIQQNQDITVEQSRKGSVAQMIKENEQKAKLQQQNSLNSYSSVKRKDTLSSNENISHRSSITSNSQSNCQIEQNQDQQNQKKSNNIILAEIRNEQSENIKFTQKEQDITGNNIKQEKDTQIQKTEQIKKDDKGTQNLQKSSFVNDSQQKLEKEETNKQEQKNEEQLKKEAKHQVEKERLIGFLVSANQRITQKNDNQSDIQQQTLQKNLEQQRKQSESENNEANKIQTQSISNLTNLNTQISKPQIIPTLPPILQEDKQPIQDKPSSITINQKEQTGVLNINQQTLKSETVILNPQQTKQQPPQSVKPEVILSSQPQQKASSQSVNVPQNEEQKPLGIVAQRKLDLQNKQAQSQAQNQTLPKQNVPIKPNQTSGSIQQKIDQLKKDEQKPQIPTLLQKQNNVQPIQQTQKEDSDKLKVDIKINNPLEVKKPQEGTKPQSMVSQLKSQIGGQIMGFGLPPSISFKPKTEYSKISQNRESQSVKDDYSRDSIQNVLDRPVMKKNVSSRIQVFVEDKDDE